MRTTLGALALLPAVFLAPCEPPATPPSSETTDQRCERLVPRVIARAAATRYTLDCTPDPSIGRPAGAAGMHVGATRAMYVWVDVLALTDIEVTVVAWHELGHAEHGPDETAAETFAYCNADLPGVGFALTELPTDCEPWRLP